MIKSVVIPDEVVMNKIYLIREQKVMLDRDLAELYGLETRVLKQAVRRNSERFPQDFMFEMNKNEFEQGLALCSVLFYRARGHHAVVCVK